MDQLWSKAQSSSLPAPDSASQSLTDPVSAPKALNTATRTSLLAS